mmetsp:Transcript_25521/g.64758  ORF Transcript_25521/g.64758 Transcript_25521/m.64758 type:complete len:458 (-) Transcript_25521:528-1901(-)|eukprot:CAMPEP_0202882708 /NCGR_PEP_ID=MMETSP1391-20130828/38398_1 /ASSEMBLY_ACC=CAM_ASM_000867 /TAXON_ID=1034604 /ORGANISM="Chlamydomonas leiostraca, Strain SAG 11-49" /LENGTH=457 /DNA_ID=CAMNT_0049565619 /DNA_START=157 /DNA_END=1530 /DNA_ORIENTATION=+
MALTSRVLAFALLACLISAALAVPTTRSKKLAGAQAGAARKAQPELLPAAKQQLRRLHARMPTPEGDGAFGASTGTPRRRSMMEDMGNGTETLYPCQYTPDAPSFYGGLCRYNSDWADSVTVNKYNQQSLERDEIWEVVNEPCARINVTDQEFGGMSLNATAAKECLALTDSLCTIFDNGYSLECSTDYGWNNTVNAEPLQGDCEGSTYAVMFECSQRSSDDGYCESDGKCFSVRDDWLGSLGVIAEHWVNETGDPNLTGFYRYGMCLSKVVEPLFANHTEEVLSYSDTAYYYVFYQTHFAPPDEFLDMLGGNETAYEVFGNCTFGQHAAASAVIARACSAINDPELGLLTAVNGTLNITTTTDCLEYGMEEAEGEQLCHVYLSPPLGADAAGDDTFTAAKCMSSPYVGNLVRRAEDLVVKKAMEACYTFDNAYNETACVDTQITWGPEDEGDRRSM